ncbi:MAG: TonB-dependent receptor [Opitutaceae bacterium]|nr:TonB-dependent receptor [Opitutaceae bacterium]
MHLLRSFGFLVIRLTLPGAAVFAPVLALADGAVNGILTHAVHGTPLPGAAVRLLPGDREVVTDRSGQFYFAQVPAGSYTLEASYLGLEVKSIPVRVADGVTAQADAQLGEGAIVMAAYTVESIREGQSRAINQQRTSNTISNIISSDAIGNLPDRTVGEALGRLPGVNVVDDSYASIRGTAAEHNAVTLDGDRFTTSGDSVWETQVQSDNRAVDLSMIPAEMVGGIEVIKALTPDMDADSFGGTINLVTRSAFDVKQRSLNGKFEYIYNDFRNQHGWAGSLTYLDVLNKARTLGVSATLTYRNEDRWTNSYEMAYYDAGAIPVGTSGSGTAGAIAAVGNAGVEEYDTRLNFQDITKLGATLNFDWKLSETTELHWRTFYEDTEREGGRFRLRARALSRWSANSTAALQSGQQVRMTNLFEDGIREQDVIRLGLDGKTKLPAGTLEYGVKYGDSTLTASRDRYIFEMPSSTERRRYAWSLDRSNPMLPRLTVTHIASGRDGLYADLADRSLTSIRFHGGKDTENDLTLRTDYSFNQPIAGRSIDWKVGAKYRGKDRNSRPSMRDFSPVAGTAPNYGRYTVVAEPRNLLDGSQPSLGPWVSLSEVLAYFRANPNAFTAPTSGEINRLEARKYDVNEDILAGYAMGTAKFDKLEVVAGLRWEQTETGYHWLADPAGASRGDQRYGELYPSVILNYRFKKNLVARFAYTHTLSRPSYGDLVPYRVLTDDTQEESGTGGLAPDDFPETNRVFLGNASLKAQQSENFDLSLEYYIQPTGVFSVAFFRKDLSDIIFRSQWKNPAEPFTIYFQDRNGSTGKAQGIELSWQQALSFLPGPLDGLGVNMNATFIDGSSVLEELVPGSTNTYRPLNVGFLPEQPEKVYNAQLWWEKYGITARVAVNYIDEFVRTSGGRTSYSINDKATRWDASLSYRVSKNFTVYVEGRNLTEEVTSWYATTPNRPEDYEFTGAVYTGGIKFRF